jgi:hypothetical protein
MRPGKPVGETHVPQQAQQATVINMMTVQFAGLLPHIRINAADPGLTATDLIGGQGSFSP